MALQWPSIAKKIKAKAKKSAEMRGGEFESCVEALVRKLLFVTYMNSGPHLHCTVSLTGRAKCVCVGGSWRCCLSVRSSCAQFVSVPLKRVNCFVKVSKFPRRLFLPIHTLYWKNLLSRSCCVERFERVQGDMQMSHVTRWRQFFLMAGIMKWS